MSATRGRRVSDSPASRSRYAFAEMGPKRSLQTLLKVNINRDTKY
jgi:hypothetical protein